MLSLLLAAASGLSPTPFAPPSSQNLPHVPLQMSMDWRVPRCMDSPVEGAYETRQAACLPVGESQAWLFSPQADGSYLIVNTASGGCLDVEGGSHATGARVLDYPCHGLSNQRWFVQSAKTLKSTYMTILWSARSGHCLDLRPQGAVQVACNWNAPGPPLWLLNEEPAREASVWDHLFRLSVKRGGLCAREVGGWIDLGPCEATSPRANRMQILPVDIHPARFQLQLASGRCLGGTASSGVLWASSVACNQRDPRQHWEVDRSGSGMQVRNLGSGQCLNAKDGRSTPGTWLIHWPCAPASDNAQWSLTAEGK